MTKADRNRTSSVNGPIITRYHNGGHDSEAIPSQWVFPKKQQKPRFLGLPLSTLLILGVEFLQQWSFGAVTIMFVQYCIFMLNIDSATTNSIMQGMNFWSLLCATVLAFMADTYWGKFKTIYVSVIVYIIGLFVLAITSTPLGFGNWPYDPQSAFWGFFVTIALIGFGSGGIKVCVSPMCAEQMFRADSQDIEKVFMYFYWTINFGNLIGNSSPYLIDFGTDKVIDGVAYGTSYYIPYSIACGAFVIGLTLFIAGTNYYTHRIPQGSVFIDFYGIVKSAFKNRKLSYSELEACRGESNESSGSIVTVIAKDSITTNASCTAGLRVPADEGVQLNGGQEAVYDEENNNYNLTDDEAANIKQKKAQGNSLFTRVVDSNKKDTGDNVRIFDFNNEKHWLYKATGYPRDKIRGVRQVFRIFPFFFYFGFYFLMYNETFSIFIMQTGWLDRPSWVKQASFIIVDPLAIIILVPIHNMFIFPFLREKCGFKLRHITRMMIGFFFLVIVYVIALVLQYKITQQGYLTEDGAFVGMGEYDGYTTSTVSVWWLFLLFVFIALSEIWAKIAFLEFCYSQAPKNMVSMVMSLYTLADALGSLLAIAAHSAFVPSRFLYTFIAFIAGMLLLVMPLFYWQFRTYESKGVYGGEVITKDEAMLPPELYTSRSSEGDEGAKRGE
eukprot:Nk52_evm9s2039 gene=Nk52_evmTU9s2039